MEHTKETHYHVNASPELLSRMNHLKVRLQAINMVYPGASVDAIRLLNLCTSYISHDQDVYHRGIHDIKHNFRDILSTIYEYTPTSDLPLEVEKIRHDMLVYISGEEHDPSEDYPSEELLAMAARITKSINRAPYLHIDSNGKKLVSLDNVHVNIARYLAKVPKEFRP